MEDPIPLTPMPVALIPVVPERPVAEFKDDGDNGDCAPVVGCLTTYSFMVGLLAMISEILVDGAPEVKEKRTIFCLPGLGWHLLFAFLRVDQIILS